MLHPVISSIQSNVRIFPLEQSQMSCYTRPSPLLLKRAHLKVERIDSNNEHTFSTCNNVVQHHVIASPPEPPDRPRPLFPALETSSVAEGGISITHRFKIRANLPLLYVHT
jgi:hypothetical protein